MGLKNDVDELCETRLYLVLRHTDPLLADRIVQFVTGIAPVLATTVRHFPYYTRHDAHHGYNVVRRIEQVVKADCLVPGGPMSFTPAEIFLLIGAAYAHDLGMTVFPGEEDALLDNLGIKGSPGWEIHPDLQAYLRDAHSLRGASTSKRVPMRSGFRALS